MIVFSGVAKNVNAVDLTVNDKRWLGRELFEKRTSYREMKNLYNMKQRTMTRYVGKVRHQRRFHEKSGRPRAIDATGLQALRDFMANNPGSDLTELKVQIIVAFHDSCRRQNKPLTELCNLTKRGYVKMLCSSPEDV